MSKRIRVTPKERRVIDVDKLVLALIRVLREQQPVAERDARQAEGGGEEAQEAAA